MSVDKEMLKKYIINIVRLNDYLDKTISIIKAKKYDLDTLKIISETSEEFFSKVEDLSTEEEEDEDEEDEEEHEEYNIPGENIPDENSDDVLNRQFRELEDLVKSQESEKKEDKLASDFLNNNISYLKKKEYVDFYNYCSYY
jgi:hypothetical protein